MYRTFIVANPMAGAGQVEREWDRIERMLKVKLPEYDWAFTEGPNHATLLTREALRNGWEMVVAIGGDGTFNEVANGFFEKVDARDHFEHTGGWIGRNEKTIDPINPDALLGMLPMGTGGDFRRTVGLMGELKENIDRLGTSDTRDCDVGQLVYIDHDGKLASRYFINIASAGFSGQVDRAVNNMWKGFGGGISFRVASTLEWFKWSNQPLDIVLDDTDEFGGDFFIVAVANGEYFGGGMWVAPGADLDDGRFQVVFMRDLSKWNSATLMTKIYQGKHLEFDETFRRDATSVSMRSRGDEPILIDLDGEQPGRLPAFFAIHERALSLKI